MNRLPFFALWTLSTVVGWAAGLLVWFAVIWLGWELIPRIAPIPYALLNLWRLTAYVLAMAALGGSIGLAQAKIAFGARVFPTNLWTLTSAFSGAGLILGVFAASLMALPVLQTSMENPNQPTVIFRIEPTWLAGTLVIGLAIGICVGLPQSFLLRRYVSGARWWLFSTIAACCVAGIIFVFIIRYFGGEFLAQLIACGALPLAFGAITGVTMQRYLRE